MENSCQANQQNLEATRKLAERGIPVCAVTARNLGLVRRMLHLGELETYCVNNNGCSVHNVKTGESLDVYKRQGQHRYRNRFEPESIGKIVDVMMSYHASFGLTGFETLYMLEGYVGAWYQALDEDMRRQLNGHIYRTKEELVEAGAEDVERMNLNLPFLETYADLSEKLAGVAEVEIWLLYTSRCV